VPQDAECFICRSSIEGQGIVSGCACHGGMGLAHVACLVRQAEMSVKEEEELNTGEGIRKWDTCFDCGQSFHGAVKLTLGWACWKTYLGRPETDKYRFAALGTLGNALRFGAGRSEEALPVLEATLALSRRGYWSHKEQRILIVQGNIASTLFDLGRYEEALVLKREIYSRLVATLGVSHQRTLLNGNNLANSLLSLELWVDGIALLRDLLPAARQLLGSNSNIALLISKNIALALDQSPEGTRDDPAFDSHATLRRRDPFQCQHRRRPARSGEHHAGRGPEATAGLRPRASRDGRRGGHVVADEGKTRQNRRTWRG